jgi:hypothetical protein
MHKEDRGEWVIFNLSDFGFSLRLRLQCELSRRLKRRARPDEDREQRIVLQSTVSGYSLPPHSCDGCEDF